MANEVVWVESGETCKWHDNEPEILVDGKSVCPSCEAESRMEMAAEAAWEERCWNDSRLRF